MEENQGVTSADLRDFKEWHIVLDECPQVLAQSDIGSKCDLAFFQTNYRLEPLVGNNGRTSYSVVHPTKAGLKLTGSDLMQDDGHVHLRPFHQRVLNSARDDRPVICSLTEWADMTLPKKRWHWWSLFRLRQLEAFASIKILGNRFTESVTAKMLEREDPVVWHAQSRNSTRPMANRTATVHYFSDMVSSITFFRDEQEGRDQLAEISDYIRTVTDPDRLIWSCNNGKEDSIRKCVTLPASARLTPKQAGTSRYMDRHTQAAMIYSGKPNFDIQAVMAHLGVPQEHWTITNEYEVIYQFVTRTAIRRADFDGHVDIYVYDRNQAQYIVDLLNDQGHITARAEFVDLGLIRTVKQAGRPALDMTPEEKLARTKQQKAESQRRLRAAKKLAENRNSL